MRIFKQFLSEIISFVSGSLLAVLITLKMWIVLSLIGAVSLIIFAIGMLRMYIMKDIIDGD